jgi:hypothetical protein
MKNTEALTKYYHDFTPMERLNLVIAAITRDDNAEVEKLLKTCPRRHYTQRDAAFVDKYYRMVDIKNIFITNFEMYSDAAGLLYIIFLSLEDQIGIYEWAIELIGQNQSKKDALAETQKEIKQLNQLIVKVSEKYEWHVAKMKSALEAYRQFCHEVGVQEENALKWLEMENLIMMLSEHLKNTDANEEFLREIKNNFYKIWQKS